MENDDDILGDNQNLEDGELWLPSDIFSMDETNDVITKKKPSIKSGASSSIFGPFPEMQGFNSAFSFGPTGSLNRSIWAEWSPSLSLHQQLNPPVQRQVEGPVLNRFGPTRSICGGSSRGGTGVFLPKITSYDRRHGQGKVPVRKVVKEEHQMKKFPNNRTTHM